MSIHRIGDVKIFVRSLDRIGNRRGEGGRPMYATLSEHALDLLRSDKRTRGVMHRNILGALVKMT